MSPSAIAQRREVDRHDVEPIEEILAEAPRLDLGLEIAVGRGDDAHVDAVRLHAADALELALLERAQELHLHLERDLADLVEEQRAAVGELEAAGAVADRAGERAALVAEQLALDEAFGDRRAVDLDERAVLARRAEVQRAGDELLARAALAGDEHRGRALGDAVRTISRTTWIEPATADDPDRELGSPASVFASRPTPAPRRCRARPRARARARGDSACSTLRTSFASNGFSR